MIEVEVVKLTGLELAQKAIETTMGAEFESRASLDSIYRWMHSPMRTQLFAVYLKDIPSFVSTHFARHVTIVPFVQSKRADRIDEDERVDRYTPVDMMFIANAEALINMAQKRLCYKASPETRDVMCQIQLAMYDVDSALAAQMVPMCVFRGGICVQPKPCGHYPGVKRYDPVKIFKHIQKKRKKNHE